MNEMPTQNMFRLMLIFNRHLASCTSLISLIFTIRVVISILMIYTHLAWLTMELLLMITAFLTNITVKSFIFIFNLTTDSTFITMKRILNLAIYAFLAFFTMKILFFWSWPPLVTLFTKEEIFLIAVFTNFWNFTIKIFVFFPSVTFLTIFADKPFHLKFEKFYYINNNKSNKFWTKKIK